VAGGHNRNVASGRFSEAQQQVLTMGGSAVGRGAFANQQVVTVGGQ
ncbi:MAG: hypothetical protein IRY87_31420, partial [Acetobacteraceae bacterium]|nr:hypothetical protein [Acetobacteraceae bacterium]